MNVDNHPILIEKNITTKKIIYFYSNVHLGDIHLGRSYVKWFVDNFDAKFCYSHNYDPEVLSDIDNLLFDNSLWQTLPRGGDIIEKDNCIYLNTWIGSGGLAIGVNFDAIHFIFSKYFNFLIKKGFYCKKSYLPRILPKIDFQHPSLLLKNIDQWFKDKISKRRIFFCNNTPESSQSFHNNLNEVILLISQKYPEFEIYISNQVQPLLTSNNVFYAEKILDKKHTFNLNELSYFSTYCDIIIGRGSGPFTFCEVVENLNKTWVSLTWGDLGPDAFNGLYKFPNQGKYIRTLKPHVHSDAFSFKSWQENIEIALKEAGLNIS